MPLLRCRNLDKNNAAIDRNHSTWFHKKVICFLNILGMVFYNWKFKKQEFNTMQELDQILLVVLGSLLDWPTRLWFCDQLYLVDHKTCIWFLGRERKYVFPSLNIQLLANMVRLERIGLKKNTWEGQWNIYEAGWYNIYLWFFFLI